MQGRVQMILWSCSLPGWWLSLDFLGGSGEPKSFRIWCKMVKNVLNLFHIWPSHLSHLEFVVDNSMDTFLGDIQLYSNILGCNLSRPCPKSMDKDNFPGARCNVWNQHLSSSLCCKEELGWQHVLLNLSGSWALGADVATNFIFYIAVLGLWLMALKYFLLPINSKKWCPPYVYVWTTHTKLEYMCLLWTLGTICLWHNFLWVVFCLRKEGSSNQFRVTTQSQVPTFPTRTKNKHKYTSMPSFCVCVCVAAFIGISYVIPWVSSTVQLPGLAIFIWSHVCMYWSMRAAAAVWSWALLLRLHCNGWRMCGHASSPRSIKKIRLMTTWASLASLCQFLPQLLGSASFSPLLMSASFIC